MPLGEAATLQRGFDLPIQNRVPGNVPIISSSGKTDTHSEARVSAPGVVTGRYGTIGQVFFVEEDFWPLNTTLWVKDFHGNDPHFVYYLFQTLDFQQFNDKSSVPGINRNHVHLHRVSIPPLETQKKIASILGALDDKIELNRRMNATLERIAQTLFKSWFVDFDPVKAKAAGLEPEGLDADTAALFPSGFQTSSLGDVPEGWEESEIGNEVNIFGGSTPSTTEEKFWHSGTHAWATPKDLSNLKDPVLLETERKITKVGLETITSKELPVGTVLMSSRAPIGYLAIAEIPVSINQGFIAMNCKTRLSNLYVLNWAQANMETIIGRGNGTTFLEISKKNFRSIPVIVPDARVILAFSDFVKPLYKRITENVREIRSLTTTRDSLLPKLLSGELDVSGFDMPTDVTL